MSLRFRKSMKLFPGAKINIGKTGIGISTGIKGAHIGINKRGVYTDVGRCHDESCVTTSCEKRPCERR